MTLTEIYTKQAAYVTRSGFTVKPDEKHGTVAIENKETGEYFFLQGDEGSDFIAGYRAVWMKAGDLRFCDAYTGHAYPYI